jgi:branched-chain amino acid aminotransferase
MAMKADKIWFDGELIDFADAKVHVLTHTLHYGVGAFEGIRAYRRADGQSHVFRLAEHMKRLFDSCHIVGMEIPYSMGELVEGTISTLAANKLPSAYIRPIAFLGDEAMGLGALNNSVHVAIATWQWGAYLGDEGLQNGIRCKVSSFTRLHPNVNMVKGKICGQYVNSVIAKREALKAGYDEAIMLDAQGFVSECSGENLFMVRGGRIVTAPYGSAILGGITRDTVLAIAADLGVAVEERGFTRDELYIADEIFLCGTAAEVTPVREVDDRRIGSGRPGEITHQISKRFFDIVSGSTPDHAEWRHTYDPKV